MKKILSLFIMFLLGSNFSPAKPLEAKLKGKIFLVVARDGSGDVTSVQEAINRVPDHNHCRKIVFIRKGVYKEKIVLSGTKTNVTLIGEDADEVILTYDDHTGRVVDTATIGTYTSFSFAADASDFCAMNLTFMNSAGPVGQAVALRTSGDRQILFHCRLIGNQDTYYTFSRYRNYIQDCYIEGTTDYIFGRTTAIFDNCHIHSLKSGSFITAASTEQGVKFGYVMRNCLFTTAHEVSKVYLGRPWRPYGQTVIMNSYLTEGIHPEGWSIWRGNENHKTCYYAEFNNTGPGVVNANRIEWAKQLSPEEATRYTIENVFARSTNPELFSHDWKPDLDNDLVYQIVKKHVKPFLKGKKTR